MNCILSLAVFAIGFLIKVDFQRLNRNQRTKSFVRAYTPPVLCRVFACLHVKSDTTTLIPGTQRDGELSLWEHMEHLAETFRLPAALVPPLSSAQE